MLDMTVDAIIKEIKRLPLKDAQKVARMVNREDFLDAIESERLSDDFRKTGEEGISFEETCKKAKI